MIPPEAPAGTMASDEVAVFPLSFAQQRLWFIHSMQPHSSAYNISMAVSVRGPLDAGALDQALAEIHRRHEILRTTFRMVDGQPAQVIAPEIDFKLERADLTGLPAGQRQAQARQRAESEARRPFDLGRGPLLRGLLLRLDPAEHVLVLVVHHIAFDGWSMGVLTRELRTGYAAALGAGAALPELPIQYADFAVWQRDWLQGPALETQLSYWRRTLAGAAPLKLTFDHARPAVQTFRGAKQSLPLGPEVLAAAAALGRSHGCSIFMVLLAAFEALMHRYSGQDDFVVGTPSANRNRAEIEPLIGFFVNTLVLRADCSGNPPFAELLERVRQSVLGAFEHQDLPFEKLVEELHPQRDLSQNPLFQVAFALQDGAGAEGELLPGLRTGILPIESGNSRLDLEFIVVQSGGHLAVVCTYNPDLFEPATIQGMLTHYRELLGSAVRTPQRRLSELDLLDAGERRRLAEWSDQPGECPVDRPIYRLVEEQAARTPEAVALDAAQPLTYGRLNTQANQLARHLRGLGAGPQSVVGLCVERGPGLLIGMLGILKTGAAYLPLDPGYPQERLAFMIRNAQAAAVVTEEALLQRHAALRAALHPVELEGRLVRLDHDQPALAAHDTGNLSIDAAGEDLAYVIYTSGSTGEPKGTCIPHRGVVRLVRGAGYLQITPHDVIAQASTASFDAATFEIWGALANGARLVVIPKETSLSPEALAETIRAHQVSVLFLTTALFNLVARERPDAFAPLGCLLFGGEKVDPEAVNRVLRCGPPRRLLHVYGPTETTTFATWYEVRGPAGSTVPIGRPIGRTTAHVLDAHRQLCPIGVPGELYIGGDGLARGYLRAPELTAARFVEVPEVAPGKLYRTGDVVRWGRDGQLEFIGRTDHQLKIRGFRIEPGEVQAVLEQHPAVAAAAVIGREDQPGEKRLVAYVVPAAGAAPPLGELRAFLAGKLPDYMVPSAFMLLERLPLNANGKLDRAALPVPDTAATTRADYTAPRTAVQKQIAQIWSELLGVEQIGIHDNFFEIGGHSLLLVRAHHRLAELFPGAVHIVDLFRFPTIADLAGHLDPTQPGGEPGAALEVAAQSSTERGGGGAIAIIGMAGRFPQAADVAAFWDNLVAGREAVTFLNDHELLASGIHPRLLNHPSYVKAAVLLDDIEQFDAGFFGYTPREAEIMDPQHRLFLECAWTALEHAAQDPAQATGSIGVFAGAGQNAYVSQLALNPELLGSTAPFQTLIGTGRDFLATRVSYKLNLTGPSLNVHTACSTSLVAVHLACRSLLDRECDMALAGGVSVSVPLRCGYLYQEEGIHSPDGHCRAFDERAQGTIRGNGVGVVVLKRLADALADGDHVHAVILGSAINNDGAQKVGYTAPAVNGQADVIRRAHAAAGVTADTIGYIEAHGTGTALGDPVEIAALGQVFGRGAGPGTCAVGSLKTNIGHLDAAAGVAGLIKAALALEHGYIPASLHFERPNPKIDFASGPFFVARDGMPWTAAATPRRAGVSSFGIGGTNAHVVLEEPPAAVVHDPGPQRPRQLLAVSARTAAGLERAAANLASFLRRPDAPSLADAAFTLLAGRKGFKHRCFVVATDAAEAAAALEAPAPDARRPTAVWDEHRPAIAFMFSGQGAQHCGMGRALYEHEPLFRQTLDRCCALLEPHLGLDLRDIMYAAAHPDGAAQARLEQTGLAQPALFATEYALAMLWQSWGVRPQRMIGHSIGEYVAACLAGVFSLEDALAVVAARGRLMQACPRGAMLAVPLPPERIGALLGDGLELAAINAPQLCVVSGPAGAVAELQARLERSGQPGRSLHVSHAFHSAMMQPAAQALAEVVAGVERRPPQLPYVSNLTGTWITAEQAVDPAYYGEHLRRTVQFSAGLETLLGGDTDVLLEVGPGNTLAGLARVHAAEAGGALIAASLPHPAEPACALDTLLNTAGRLWLAGAPLSGRGQHPRGRRVVLPTYPFERRRYWVDPKPAARPALLPAGRRPDMADWFYVPSWTRIPGPRPAPSQASSATAPGSTPPETGPWLLLGEGGGLQAALADTLRAQGNEVLRAQYGSEFAELGPGAWAIDPCSPQDHQRLLAECFAAGRTPAHIVHLELAGGSPVAAGAPFADHDPASFSVLYLLQALAAMSLASYPRVGVVTSEVHDVIGDEPLCPAKSWVLGFVQVAGVEHRGLICRSIDVPAPGGTGDSAIAQAVVNELRAGGPAAVAYRAGQRWVPRYDAVRLEAPGQPPARLRPGGVYLITGGLGGMGLALAEYLARTVGARLVLVGRTPLPSRDAWESLLASEPATELADRIRRIQDLESAGAQFMLCAADVADRAAMAEVVAAAVARFGAIHGVIHAAGVAGGGILQRQTPEQVRATLAPKVQGTLALDQALAGQPLDFVVLCSSLISQWTLPGRGDYAAANLFLDAFARWKRRRGGPAVISINWDGWGEVGMAVRRATQRHGTVPSAPLDHAMLTGEGVDAFARILNTEHTQVIVSVEDLAARLSGGAQPAATGAAASSGDAAGDGSRGDGRGGSPLDGRDGWIEDRLLRICRELPGLEQLAPTDDLLELAGGEDLAIEIIRRAAGSGIHLTPRQLLEHRSIRKIAATAGPPQPERKAPAGAATVQAEARETGPVPLTPIQRWFFQQPFPERHHFNQALLLEVRRPLSAEVLQAAIAALVERHDALGLCYVEQAGGWRQVLAASTDPPPVEVIDLAQLPAGGRESAVTARAAELQRSLDLAHGPLMRVALFDFGPQTPGRLLLIFHHLIMDIVSLRMLQAELEELCAGLAGGQPAALPAPGTPLREWALQLQRHQHAPRVRAQLAWWRDAAPASPLDLPLDHPGGRNTVDSTAAVQVELNEDDTRVLLRELPRHGRARIDEAVTAAVALALQDWTGRRSAHIALEGHGRLAPLDGVDVARTVGWFTCVYPVHLHLPPGAPEVALAAVREQLRSVPDHGLGYGLLAFGDDPAVAAELQSLPQPQILMLYLGQVDGGSGGAGGDGLFAPARESVGPLRCPQGLREHVLGITAVVRRGRLQATWVYSRNLHERQTIQDLADRFAAALTQLAGHARQRAGAAAAAAAALDAQRPAQSALRPQSADTVEGTIREVLCQVLGVPAVGADDNFFEAGGDSLMALQVAAMLKARLGVDVPIVAFYESPTPALLARKLSGASGGEPDREPRMHERAEHRLARLQQRRRSRTDQPVSEGER